MTLLPFVGNISFLLRAKKMAQEKKKKGHQLGALGSTFSYITEHRRKPSEKNCFCIVRHFESQLLRLHSVRSGVELNGNFKRQAGIENVV